MGKPYSTPALTPKMEQAIRNGDFEFLLPYSKALYRTDEVATTIGREQTYVRELVDNGRLEAHRDSATGTRKSNLVTRRSVVLYLAETANYDPAYLVLRIEAVLKTMRARDLDRLISTAQRQKNRIT